MAQAQKKENGIWETIKTVFWALVIAGVFRDAVFPTVLDPIRLDEADAVDW
jgi:hypothetical protein